MVFNSDPGQLPHVLNVNNKPPVTCYEAGYFVEAGYFDQSWQPYRGATLDRVKALQLPVRRIHVAAVGWGKGPGGEPQVVAEVKDAAGKPVAQARVTVLWGTEPPRACSGVTGPQGIVAFPLTLKPGAQRPCCQVLNVMATGAVYDYPADWMTSTHEGDLRLRVQVKAPGEAGQGKITVETGTPAGEVVEVTAQADNGEVFPPVTRVAGNQSGIGCCQMIWAVAPKATGWQRVRVTARVAGTGRPGVVREVWVPVGGWPEHGVRLTEAKAADLTEGQPYAVSLRLLNEISEPLQVKVWGTLLEMRQSWREREVCLTPGEEQLISWEPPRGAPPLPRGIHKVRVGVRGYPGATAVVEFAVK